MTSEPLSTINLVFSQAVLLNAFVIAKEWNCYSNLQLFLVSVLIYALWIVLRKLRLLWFSTETS